MSPTTIPGNFVIQSPAANDPLLDLNTQPSLDLQFATSKTLDDRVSGQNLITFDRNSSGTYVDSQGVIQMAGHNLLTYSEDLDNTAWTKLSVVVNDNSTTDPNGNLTADLLTRTADRQLAYQLSPAAGTYVFSIYAKAGSSNFVTLGSSVNYRGNAVTFNLSTGTPGSVVNYYSGTDATIAVSNPIMTDVGGGWWRCQINVNHTTGRAVHIEPGDLTNTAASAYFWGAQLEVSGKASPYIKTTNLPSAAPRFDHDPATNTSLGLLVEESRTNLVTNSEDLTGWSTIFAGDGVNPTAQNISDTAPDGGTTVTEITFQRNTANTSDYSLYREQYGTTAVSTGSVYVKAARPSDVGKVIDFYHNQGAPIDFNSVTLTDTWQRVSSVGAGVIAGFLTLGLYNATSSTGQVKILAWGAQLEEGFPTSYIPTSGSTVTRAADVASITGSNFSRWYNQSEGTVFTDKTFTINNGHTYYFTDSTLTTNRFRLQGITHSGNNSSDGSFFQASVAGNKTAIGLQTDNVSVNGGTPDTSFTLPSSLDRLFIGRHATVSSYLNGHIARLTYYPYRLPDATLQEITS